MRLSFENSWELRPEFPGVDNEQQKLQTKNQTSNPTLRINGYESHQRNREPQATDS